MGMGAPEKFVTKLRSTRKPRRKIRRCLIHRDVTDREILRHPYAGSLEMFRLAIERFDSVAAPKISERDTFRSVQCLVTQSCLIVAAKTRALDEFRGRHWSLITA
jgi:hypothetical protein